MRPELIAVDGEIVGVRLAGEVFAYEPESGESIIPKRALHGFCLSDIPDELVIKPVESIDGRTIEIKNDIALSCFAGDSASALVELMLRRKYWDGEVGLSPYVNAYRQAIRDHEGVEETSFQDDGDFVFLHYEITISEDLEIGEAIIRVDSLISVIEERADQLVRRRVDPLLGILDRGSFDAELTFALKHVGIGIGLALADIDHFKKVNDEYGHQRGDAVLRAVAQVLSTACHEHGGTAYRYGGEELAAMLISTDKEKIMSFAESVRRAVEKLSFADAPQLKISVSLGVALAVEDENTFKELLKRADAAMYRAKEEGRNRVVAAG